MNEPATVYLDFAMINGAVVESDRVRVSPLGAGFMYGEGFFETVRVEQSQPVSFEAHYARLAISLSFFRSDPIPSRPDLASRCAEVIEANSLVNGSLKIIVFKDVAGWGELIFARPVTYTAAQYEAGFNLMTVACDRRIDPLHALKSLNYLPNSYAKRIARAAGFDEALFFDPDQRVLEGASTNVFLVKDGVVKTPRLESGILPGVMRARVIQACDSVRFGEGELSLDEVHAADEVFVTNAVLGVMPVARVDATTYNLARNSVTRSLMAELRAP